MNLWAIYIVSCNPPPSPPPSWYSLHVYAFIVTMFCKLCIMVIQIYTKLNLYITKLINRLISIWIRYTLYSCKHNMLNNLHDNIVHIRVQVMSKSAGNLEHIDSQTPSVCPDVLSRVHSDTRVIVWVSYLIVRHVSVLTLSCHLLVNTHDWNAAQSSTLQWQLPNVDYLFSRFSVSE